MLKEVGAEYIEAELDLIGFDKSRIDAAACKFRCKNIKIYGLTSPQANILKQTALSLGADCAVNRNVVTGEVKKSDAILCGNLSQLKKIAEKLKVQPFGLKILADNINGFIESKPPVRTKLAGILNITPDSFSDGGKYFEPQKAQQHLIELIQDGADLIDIGAESTRPYSEPVEPDEQIRRLKPIFDFIKKENIKVQISVDTKSSKTAEFVLDNGAAIINDVAGFDFDSKMPEVIAKYQGGVIIGHSNGRAESTPSYKNIIEDTGFYLKNKIEAAQSYGIKNIIADPGIGFGKTREDNFNILRRIKELDFLKCPVMVGVSRKRLLNAPDADNNLKDILSCALAYSLILQGVDYLRVHNVKMHKQILNSLPV